ncbi:MAG: succinate dehydrogenase, cytochrome b556 subunit [Gammaproteobacteria bacterium]|nr:succinate dehydrogenase, cytochrome b556 subunit [Gammaproteobacteria bacterium]MCW8909292.1 succinate dehydrogenase, cytochrome b556 subunit [Gammaproteobacteria bacterium]MCW9003947.1 succinate dehydrogenase, cytochrome b556 subunit [Gammaproteobacteria bacterium]
MASSDSRPFFLNLIKIRLPIPGVVSIFHRVSGIFLFLAIPWSVYLLELSLRGDEGFNAVLNHLDQLFIKLILLILTLSLVHHFFAGIRFLLTDFDIGLGKQQSKNTAWMVFILEFIAFGLIMYGVCL